MGFHRDHTDEVLSMAVHPTRSLCATGQQGKLPSICVWDYRGRLAPRTPHGAAGTAPSHGERRSTKPTRVTLHGAHRRGASHLCFSGCGRYLASIGMDDRHTLVVHDWEAAAIVAQRATTKDVPFDLQFIPPPPPPQHAPEEGEAPLLLPPLELVQVGVNILRFWTITDGGHNLGWRSATLGAEGQWQTFLCVGFVGVDPWRANDPNTPKPTLNGMRTVVGCQDGSLYLLAGSQLSKVVIAHTGPVNVMRCVMDGIATGGHDGLVKVWKYHDKTSSLEVVTVVDVAVHGSVAPIIRSLDWDTSVNRLLIGTLGAEVFELSSRDGTNCTIGGGSLLQSHAHGDLDCELHGIAAHPTLPRFVTTGDDATLRVWDAHKNGVIAMTALESPSRAVCFSPSGDRVAVGFGCPLKKKAKQADGKWVIMGSGDFSILANGVTDGGKYLSAAAWSPNGSILCFGSADNRIYIYNADDGYALKAAAVAHDAPIRSIDFTRNSAFIAGNCSLGALQFFDAESGGVITDLAKIKDQKWETCTGPAQWAASGVWPPEADNSDVLTCDAVHHHDHGSGGHGVLATGDNFGKLRLWRYPCDSALSQSKLYRAHGASSPAAWVHKGNPPRRQPANLPAKAGEGCAGLTKARWVAQGRYLITIAGREKVIFQWSFDSDELGQADASIASPMAPKPDPKVAALTLGVDAEPEALEGLSDAAVAAAKVLEDAAEAEKQASKKKGKDKKKGHVPPSDAVPAFLDLPGSSAAGGDETSGGNVDGPGSGQKPWLSAMVEPSDLVQFGDLRAPPPIKALSLERCFGCQVAPPGCRTSNLGYTSTGDAVWAGAGLAIVYDKQSHSQRLFRGHGGKEVTCVAVSPCGRFIASGDKADRCTVRLWDASGGQEIACLGPFHRRGVAALAWSGDGSRVVSVGCDVEHSVALWGTHSGLWEDARKVDPPAAAAAGYSESSNPSAGRDSAATSRPLASKLGYSPGDHRPVYFATFLDPLCWGAGGLYNQESSAHSGDSGEGGSGEGVGPMPKHPGYLFATGGVDHVKLWSAEGRTLSCERGLWGAAGRVQPLLCGAAAGARLVAGGLSGHMYAWRGRHCEKVVKAHRGPVGSLWACTFSDGTGGCIVSGGFEDGTVCIRNERLEPLGTFDLANAEVPPLLAAVRGVGGSTGFGVRAAGLGSGEFVNRVLVSTASAEIYELSPDTGSFTLLSEGHFSDPVKDGSRAEVWGLDAHPSQADFVATCGDDGTVRVWSLSQGRMLRKVHLDSSARCVVWSPDGSKLLVGLGGSAVANRGRQVKDGAFVLLDALSMEVSF